MTDYKEVTGRVQVPPNTGLEGFLSTIKQIIRRPRVQEIVIDSRGSVSFRRFVLEGEAVEGPNNNFGVDFQDLQPWYIIRNAQLEEVLLPPNPNAAVAIGYLFEKAAADKLRPLAFATGANTSLWDWYQLTTGRALPRFIVEGSPFFGLPVLTDRQIPDTALLLAAGYGRDAAFVDTQKSYKVEIPQYVLPNNDVEVIP